MKKEEIELLVKFAIRTSKKVDIYKIKKSVENFIACQPDHIGEWVYSENGIKDYTIPEMPILLEVIRETELKRVKSEREELDETIETLEDKDEFEAFVAFVEYEEEKEK